MGEIYDVSIIADKKMEWNKELEKTIQNLVKSFPKDEEKIRNYFKLTRKVSDGCGLFFATKILPNWLAFIVYLFAGYYSGYKDKTCEEIMCGELGMSKELMFTLCYLSGDHGSLPTEKGSFVIQSLVAVHYAESGGWYPVGGPKEIAESIIPIIEATGGKVLVKAKVESILIKNNKAYGVKTTKGQEIYANVIVSNAGVFNTFGKLIPNVNTWKSKLKTVKEGVSHFYLFVGFNSTDLNLPKSNYWIHPTCETENLLKYRESKDCNSIEWEKCGFFISFPSSKDPLYNSRYPNKSTCVVIAEANYDWVKEWSDSKVKQRGNDYEEFKSQVQKEMLKVLLKHFPHVESSIDYMDVGTPLTNEYYLNSYKGSSYGLKFTSNNEIFKPETSIQNLYLTGQDVTCMGFAGAVSGAMISYIAITGDDILSKLSNLKK
jgi:all-trans-retinol 13,14-reductase